MHLILNHPTDPDCPLCSRPLEQRGIGLYHCGHCEFDYRRPLADLDDPHDVLTDLDPHRPLRSPRLPGYYKTSQHTLRRKVRRLRGGNVTNRKGTPLNEIFSPSAH